MIIDLVHTVLHTLYDFFVPRFSTDEVYAEFVEEDSYFKYLGLVANYDGVPESADAVLLTKSFVLLGLSLGIRVLEVKWIR